LSNLNVLVVDDTIVYRKIVSDVLSEIPGVTVVGSANNGKTALHKIASLKPDLITLDIEMPEMNGLQVLEQLRKDNIDVSVIMLSTLTVEGGEMTIQAEWLKIDRLLQISLSQSLKCSYEKKS